MRTRWPIIRILSACLVYSSVLNLLQACWILPPDVVVEQTRNGDLFIRKLNPEKVVEVRRSADMALLWSVHLPDYDPIFSRIVLDPDGATLVHIRGNHLIDQMDDVAVEVWRQDGTYWQWLVRDLRPDLPKSTEGASTSPRHEWHDGAEVWLYDRILLRLGPEKGATVWFAKPELRSSLTQTTRTAVRSWRADSN